MPLSDRIAALLARREGTRPADIARIAGVSTASVADWMSGATKSMKPDPARRLSASFGCDQNWLMTGIGTPAWSDAVAAEVAPDVEHLQPKVSTREALSTIRNLLTLSAADHAEIGEALKLMAKVPDSDRAFEQALALLSALSTTRPRAQ